MEGRQLLLSQEDPDESSYGRVRRLSNTDVDDVIAAIQGPEKVTHNKTHSFIPLIAILIFVIIYVSPIFTESPTAHSCLAMLVFAGILWGTEIIPSYITAYITPLMSVWLSLGYDTNTGTRIPASKMAELCLEKFSDPIIFVILGSLTLSAALSKLQITERISAAALSRIRPTPKIVLFAVMLLNFGISTVLSNIASTTLVLSFSLPIIRSLDPDDPYIKAILFGLAWSGNAGGLTTPIASVQNILAVKYINSNSDGPSISFLEWVAFGAPPGLVILILYWLYLALRFKPTYTRLVVDLKKTNFAPWTWKHTYTCVVTITTIILWALEETIPAFLGHVGVTALISIISLFSAGILNSDDFGSLRWSTIALMGGGLALGEAMDVSGLLVLLSDSAAKLFSNVNIWVVCFIFLVVESILVSVINHVSAGAILFPVLKDIGTNLGHPNLLLNLSALMIGVAQLFAISSFPNALISGVQKHKRGDPGHLLSESFLTGKDYVVVGWPTIVIAVLVLSGIGYGLIVWLKL